MVHQFGLEPLMDRSVFKLSGGEKQRIAFAAACMLSPKLLVLDEPTSGLDRGSMQQVGSLLQQLKNLGKTLIVITHDEELAADWCDRVIQWNDR